MSLKIADNCLQSFIKEITVKLIKQIIKRISNSIENRNCKNIKEIIIAIPMPLGVGRVWLDLSFGISIVFKYFSMGILYLINKQLIKKLIVIVVNHSEDMSLIKIIFL